jgi:hypothetical protein
MTFKIIRVPGKYVEGYWELTIADGQLKQRYFYHTAQRLMRHLDEIVKAYRSVFYCYPVCDIDSPFCHITE